jgi:MFS family permease
LEKPLKGCYSPDKDLYTELFSMPQKLQYRIAIVLVFFVNGFLYANVTGRLPELKDFFGVSDSVLGTMLFGTAIGALAAMPLAGWLTTRFNSGRLMIVCGILFCCMVPLIPFSHNWWIARAAFLLTGFFSGAMDITMNGQAIFVERSWSRTIMSSFHAAFSIGMALGAGTGALFANHHFGIQPHLWIMAAVCILVMAAVSPIVLRSQPTTRELPTTKSKARRIPPLIWLIAIVGFCGMTGEGSMVDWSALYLHTVVGESKAFSALAVGSFATAMTIGRIFGDRLTEAAGKPAMLLGSCISSIAGLAIALSFVSAPVALAGFFLVGLGLSNVVPITYSTAGNIRGMDPAAGIAIASTIGYSGFFVSPPTIGYLADSFGLRIGLCFVLGLLLVMLFFIFLLIRYERSQQTNAGNAQTHATT